MVGQDAVVKVLSHSLQQKRLHHAWLFTGTRGVGKTTVARILARAMSCEQGVTDNPCGECGICKEFLAGGFPDFIEIDAASRTKVEQTRELLENLAYAPVSGRYKIYLIDEVHMLSPASFNALLKNLEEPPEHVCFMFATTEPRKIPATVLSRCLHLHLRPIGKQEIQKQLEYIMQQEDVTCEPAALSMIATTAQGSMRDALTVCEQAISFCAGNVTTSAVSQMLGEVNQNHILRILETLAKGDGASMLKALTNATEGISDGQKLLERLLKLLQDIAFYQVLDGQTTTLADYADDMEQFKSLADNITPEDIQLFYQIGLLGLRDMPFMPDPHNGIKMILLRMLTFHPVTEVAALPDQNTTSGKLAEAVNEKSSKLTQTEYEEKPSKPSSAEIAALPDQNTTSGKLAEAVNEKSSKLTQTEYEEKPSKPSSAEIAALPDQNTTSGKLAEAVNEKSSKLTQTEYEEKPSKPSSAEIDPQPTKQNVVESFSQEDTFSAGQESTQVPTLKPESLSADEPVVNEIIQQMGGKLIDVSLLSDNEKPNSSTNETH